MTEMSKATALRILGVPKGTGRGVLTVSSREEWKRLMGYDLGAAAFESAQVVLVLKPRAKYQHARGRPFTLTKEQIAEWRQEQRRR